MNETEVLWIIREHFSKRHKLALEEFSFSVSSFERKEDGFEVEGKYRVYSLGGFRFRAKLDHLGRVSSFEERIVKEP